MKVLCSSGDFIGYRNNYDYSLLTMARDCLSCDGFEILLPFEGRKESEVARFIDKYHICVPIVHADKMIGDLISMADQDAYNRAISILQRNCIFSNYIGAREMVVHLWGGSYSDKNIDKNIEKYLELVNLAEQYSVHLMIENVPCAMENPLIHFESLYKIYKDIAFTYDFRFAEFHAMSMDFFHDDNIAQRIKHIHVSDYLGGLKEWEKLSQIKNIGQGIIDFKHIFGSIKSKIKSEYITIEVPCYKNNKCDFATLEDNIQKVKTYLEMESEDERYSVVYEE
jgi:Sugar phosphate isomerases/epimerases